MTLGLIVIPWLRIGAAVVALLMLYGAIAFLRAGRATPDPDETPDPNGGSLQRYIDSVSPASRSTIGVVLLLLAYHAVVYTNPQWDTLQVPRQHAWILLLGSLATVAASLAMDRNT